MRKAATDLADTFFRGSLNDGISSDIFLQQYYHQSEENRFNHVIVKTDDERYFDDGCDVLGIDEYNAAAVETEL